MFYNTRIQDIMKEWKKEAKVKQIVLYRLSREPNEYNDAKYKLRICTNRVGPFIGFRGALHDKYRNKIAEVLNENVMIDFIETSDIV